MKHIVSMLIASTITATALASATQAIVFDFGGVFTGEPNREFVTNFLKNSFDLSEKEFNAVYKKKREAVKNGKTDVEFWLSYADENGIKLPPDWSLSFKSVIKNAIGVNQEMYDLVEQLRKTDIPIAMLSNIDGWLAKFIKEMGLYEPFNPCLLSCDIGYEKPDPRIYEFLLSQLNLPAESIVFIDDRSENVEAAKLAGLDAILFESEAQLRYELTKRDVL